VPFTSGEWKLLKATVWTMVKNPMLTTNAWRALPVSRSPSVNCRSSAPLNEDRRHLRRHLPRAFAAHPLSPSIHGIHRLIAWLRLILFDPVGRVQEHP
jgi:hypothetical protein